MSAGTSTSLCSGAYKGWSAHMRLPRPIVWVLYACLLVLPFHAFAESCTCKSKVTVRVSGRTVVFYTLSQPEFDSLSSEDQEAYTELLSDFYEYSERLGHYFDKHGIKHILTGSRHVEVKVGNKTYCYDKTKLKEEVGVILSDGRKQPKVIPGLFTDSEVMPAVVKYYSL